MSKLSERLREEMGPEHVYWDVVAKRDDAFREVCKACSRYGAAKNPQEKREALKAFNLAQDAYKERREEVMRIVGVEYVLHSAQWIERQWKRRQHPGAQWSSERCAGYRAAIDLIEDWVLEIVRRAKTIVEYPPRVEPPKETIGERAARMRAAEQLGVESEKGVK